MEQIARRHQLDISPFVSAWNAEVDRVDSAAAPVAHGGTDISSLTRTDHLWHRLLKVQLDDYPIDAAYSTFAGTSLLMRAALVSQCTLSYERRDRCRYLMPLLEHGKRLGSRLSIATLNYDNTVELLAAVEKIPIDVIIDEAADDGRPELLKLHGSATWRWSQGSEGSPPRVREHRPGRDVPNGNPVIVFGRDGKLRSEGPFLDLFARFRQSLKDAGALVVVGYSFRDTHINEWIDRWLSDDAHRALVIDPEPGSPALQRAARWGERFRVAREPASVGLQKALDTVVAQSPSKP